MSETYTVRYKYRGQLFWRKLKGISGDLRPSFLGEEHVAFIKEDNSAVIMPTKDLIIEFPQERDSMIRRREADRLQQIQAQKQKED